MGTLHPGKSNRLSGFTLIELAVVLFIVSLILWTALPKISTITKEDIDEFMRNTAMRIESTMEKAMFESAGGKITIKMDDGVIEGYRQGEEGNFLMNWRVKLPGSHTITSVTTNFGKSYETGEVDIPYSHMGYIPRTYIVVSNVEERKDQTITINPFTGKVEITDGIITEKM